MSERENLLFVALMVLIGGIVLAGMLASEGTAAIVAVFGSAGLIAVTIGTRSGGRSKRQVRPPAAPPETPRALLERRLAMGEIDTDEFLERESALRDAARH